MFRPARPLRPPGARPPGPPVQQALPTPHTPTAPGEKTTVEGEVVRVTYENGETGFRVLRIAVDGRRDPETLVGVFPAAPPGTRVRATGQRTRDAKHGDQFKVETLLAVEPSTLEGLERYLGSGMIQGVGPAYAKRIVEAFGENVLEVLDRSPERLRSVPGLGRGRADAVASARR